MAFTDDTSSEELALMAQEGDVAAYNELIIRYQDRLFHFLHRRMKSHQDAEDITQETFIRAYDKIHLYNAKWRFSTWLFTIATRLAASHARKAKSTVSLNQVEFGAGYMDEPDGGLSQQELVDQIWEMADRILSENQSNALYLRYSEERSIKEIAQIMGKTSVYVRVLLYRAREALITELKAQDPDFLPHFEEESNEGSSLNRLRGLVIC